MDAFTLTETTGSTFRTFIGYLISLISILNPILFILAFVVFFWGLSKFILNAGNQAENQKGRNYMLWGILALFILVSVMTIIKLISNDLGLTTGDNQYPFLPTH